MTWIDIVLMVGGGVALALLLILADTWAEKKYGPHWSGF